MTAKKCRYMEQARNWQEREVGCPLDHCQCGTHDVDNLHHTCKEEPEYDPEILAAERAAGWDPNP